MDFFYPVKEQPAPIINDWIEDLETDLDLDSGDIRLDVYQTLALSLEAEVEHF